MAEQDRFNAVVRKVLGRYASPAKIEALRLELIRAGLSGAARPTDSLRCRGRLPADRGIQRRCLSRDRAGPGIRPPHGVHWLRHERRRRAPQLA